MDLSPLYISLQSALTATAAVFILGILGAWFAYGAKRMKWLIDAVFTVPLVLPPTVVGFFLLLLFGRNGPLGRILEGLGYSLVFTVQGGILASVVVAYPLMYRTSLAAFEQIDKNIIYAAETLGLSRRKIFFKIILPNSRSGILAGTVLTFTRALGEFGASIMISGNIPKKTQTIAMAVYSAVQSGNQALALKWVAVAVGISLISVILMNLCIQRNKFVYGTP